MVACVVLEREFCGHIQSARLAQIEHGRVRDVAGINLIAHIAYTCLQADVLAVLPIQPEVYQAIAWRFDRIGIVPIAG